MSTSAERRRLRWASASKESGGEGSRTPVLEAVYTSFYMLIRCLFLRSQTMHRHTADSRASTKFLHPSARSLRRQASLLSMSPPVAGVQSGTSRSIKPRERDLGDLRLFFLVRILTRPTNHPRHAACISNNESKPVRPLTTGSIPRLRLLSRLGRGRASFSLHACANR